MPALTPHERRKALRCAIAAARAAGTDERAAIAEAYAQIAAQRRTKGLLAALRDTQEEVRLA